MDGLSRAEYPGMLANLQPGLAVFVLQERAKRIGKINQEIADWLLERRKVEEQYVAGLKKLLLVKAPNSASELGVFQPAWESILNAVDAIASSHHLFSSRIEKDIEVPLRSFQNTKEMGNLTTISANLNLVAKELEDAQDKADRLSKKGGKTSSQKMDAAAQRLESATQQWDSQAPFVFETLQALDEQRTNHLRDILTQLETHEVDQASQNQATAEALLNVILEIKTEDEIQGFAQRVTSGRPKMERRANSRQSTIPGASTGSSYLSHPSHTSQSSHPPLPPVPQQHQQQYQQQLQQHHHQNTTRSDDTVSEHSGRNDAPSESKLRSRLGTMLGRRRQSVHGGFGPLSPAKGSSPFGVRPSQSSHGRAISPRASSNNLTEMNHRLSSLAETPGSPEPPSTAESRVMSTREGTTNGVNGTHGTHGSNGTNGFGSDVPAGAAGGGARAAAATMHGMTADDIFGVPPPPGPPPSQQKAATAAAAPTAAAPSSPTKDAEGFTIPARPNDPISQAQRDATAVALGEDGEPAFKLNIQKEPVADEDAAAKKAAMSNVANTLTMAMPSRKAGTVRGRRDVRNTIYVPSMPVPDLPTGSSPSLRPTSPTISPSGTRPAAVAALATENSIGGASDTQSIRSATSLGGLAHLKHPDMSGPGLSTSVIETVSASFEDGELKLAKIAGEMAFAYNPSPGSAKDTETIRVNNMELLEAIGPNRIFVRNTAAADTFELNTTHLQAHKPTVGFTFRALGESATALGKHCPLVVKPVWKPTGDKLGLLLQYRLNPAAAATMAGPVTLHNLVLIATYEGARASGVQTKPTGTHIKDKHLVYWRIGDVTLTDAWAKIVCRIVGQQGGEPQPGHIEARWEYAVPAAMESSSSSSGSVSGSGSRSLGVGIGISISQLESTGHGKGKDRADEDDDEVDPFADEIAVASSKPADSGSDAGDSWVEVATVRQIVSGRYEAK